MAAPAASPPPTARAVHASGREGLAGSDGAAAWGRRFKRGASRLPPGPRRTPDHPPYAEMIQVALRALAEEGGSTVDAISGRIVALYLDLPWAHERLLPHYLRRLVAAGDVAVATPGRYALLSPSPAPAGDANADPNPNPSHCSQPTTVAVRSDGAVAVADDGAGDGLVAPTLAIAVAAASSCGDGESQCDHSSMPGTATGHGGDEGRPSGPDPTSATALVVRLNELPSDHGCPSGAVAGHHSCILEPKIKEKRGRGRPPLRGRGRGRGRPPNAVRFHWKPASGIHVSDPGNGGALLPECGEGRPASSFILSGNGPEGLPLFTPCVLTKRKRGRPRKYEPTVVMSDAISAHDSVHLLNVTSSHDGPKHMELHSDANLSQSLGDGTGSAGGKVLSNCAAAPRLKVVFRMPRKPEQSVAEVCSAPDVSLLADSVAVHVPKRPRTSVDHKPRKFGTTLFEERASDVPLILSSEQMVCALPANVQHSSPKDVVRSQPQIEGWVQVLLAVKPATANVQKVKEKKRRQHCKERKPVHPTVQLRPDDFLLNMDVENAAQMDAWLQTCLTEQFNTDDLFEEMADENWAEMQRCIQLISALNLDPNGSTQTTQEENLPHVDRGNGPMSNASFHAMEEENVAHDVEGRKTLLVGHSVPDDSLQTGKEECRTQSGVHVESLPPEDLTPAGSLQISTETVANMEMSMQLSVAELSKTEDSLRREERIGLHAEVYVAEPLVKQLINRELGAKPLDEGSIEGFTMGPEDDLQADEVNESDPKRCLQVLPKFGDDLQTENMSEPPSVEFLLDRAEQYTFGDPLQSQEVDNMSQFEESVQELHVQNFKPLDDLHSEKKNESYAGEPLQSQEVDNRPQVEESIQELHVLLHFKPLDDLQSKKKSESNAGDCVQIQEVDNRSWVEESGQEFHAHCSKLLDDLQSEKRNESYAGDSLQSQEVDNRLQIEESVQELHLQHFKILDDLQSEKKNESDAGDHGKMLHCEQAKLQCDLPFEMDKNGTHALGSMLEGSAKESLNADSSWMHWLQEGSQHELFHQKASSEQKNPRDALQTEGLNQLHAENYVQAPHEEQPKLGVDLLNKADENGRNAEAYVPELPKKGPVHGDSLQSQGLENKPQDEEFTLETSMDQHPTEDNLQMKGHVESHVDEHLQVFPQEQHKPGDDLQMENRSRAHAEGLVFQLPPEKSMVCDFGQVGVSENNTQTEESIQVPSSNLSKPEDPLQMEGTNGLHCAGFLQGPEMELSMTSHPLQSQGENNMSSKRNKKRKRRLWFEG